MTLLFASVCRIAKIVQWNRAAALSSAMALCAFGAMTLLQGALHSGPVIPVCSILLGAAIALTQQASKNLLKGTQIFATAAMLLALWQLFVGFVQSATGDSAGEFVAAPIAAADVPPTDCFNVILIAIALLCLGSGGERKAVLGQLFGLAAACVSLLALLAYLYGVPGMDHFSEATSPLAASSVFLIAACGTLAIQPRAGLLRFLTEPGVGGIMARRILPVIVLVPIGLGGLWMWGERRGSLDFATGLALFVVAEMIILVALVVRVAQLLGAADRAMKQTAALLENDREFLRVVVENVREGIVACDANGVLTVFNDVTRRLHGLPKRAIPPDRWAEHYDMFHVDGVTQLTMEEVPLIRALQGDAVREMEMVLAPKSGSPRHILANAQTMYGKHGEKLGAVVVLHDITARKKMDDALRESEQRLRTVVSSAPVVMWTLDLEGRFTFSDGNALPALRLGAGMAVGHSVFEVFSHNPEVCRHFHRAIQGEEVNAVVETKGVVFEMRLSALRGAEEAITGVIGVATDITQRRRAEEALRRSHAELETRIASRTMELTEANQQLHVEMADRERAQAARRHTEERLQAIIDNAPAVIFVKDLLGRYVLVNRAFEQLAGSARADILGKKDGEIFPPEQADSFAQNDHKVRLAGAPIQLEETLASEDGHRTFISIRFPLCAGDGVIYAICGIATEITERKRADERLRLSEERFSLLVDGVQDYGIFMLDPEGRVESWNRGAQRLNGYDADEIIGQPLSRFSAVEAGQSASGDRELHQAASSGRSEHEGWRVRKDGSQYLANVVITALRESSGKLRGFASVTRDITERRRVEEELLNAKEEAERANEAKSEFLSRMSHEFRTPLNAILGFGQLLEMDELGGEQASGVQQILRAGEHLLGLVNEVLDISRIESGDAEFVLETVAVGEVIGETFDLVKKDAEARGIALRTEIPHGTTQITADRQRLKQILINLLSNAVKYNHAMGSVTVSLDHSPAGPIKIHVRDTGPGIPAGKMRRLFTPFDRLGAEERGIDGTGIGLTLSRWLARGMGGTLDATSIEGEGCTFTLGLPVAGAAIVAEVHTEPLAIADV